MTTYPRLTTELNGDYLRMAQDWDPMVRIIRDTIAGFTPTAGNFNLPCNFLITKDASDYVYAISGGQIIYGGPDDVGGVDGTNFGKVVQAAIDYSSNGGIVFVKRDNYTLTYLNTDSLLVSLHVKYGVHLICEPGTVITLSGVWADASYAVYLDSAKSLFGGCEIDGNSTVLGVVNKNIIVGVVDAVNATVENCFIHDGNYIDFSVDGTSDHVKFCNIISENNGGIVASVPVAVGIDAGHTLIENLWVINTLGPIGGGGGAQGLDDRGYMTTLRNCYFSDIYNAYAITHYTGIGFKIINCEIADGAILYGDGHPEVWTQPTYGEITGCKIYNTGYCIEIDAGAQINIHDNPLLQATEATAIYIHDASDTGLAVWNKIHDNFIYVTDAYDWIVFNTDCGADNEFYHNNCLGTGTIHNNSGKIQHVHSNLNLATETNQLSSTFAIDSTGIKEVTFTHGLKLAPAAYDVMLTVKEESVVDDWEYNLLKVTTVNDTYVIARINVSKASSTGSATARLICSVKPNW
jgi:hypothetical protein